MSHQENLKIIALVGLTGSGKTAAVEYLTGKGFPKVRNEHGQDVIVSEIIDQIQHLSNAGQHRVVADGLYSWDEYKALKHAFPSELTVVALVTPRHLRYHRLSQRTEDHTQTEAIHAERDYDEIETMQKGGPIAMADFYVMNDGDKDALYAKLDGVCEEIGF